MEGGGHERQWYCSIASSVVQDEPPSLFPICLPYPALLSGTRQPPPHARAPALRLSMAACSSLAAWTWSEASSTTSTASTSVHVSPSLDQGSFVLFISIHTSDHPPAEGTWEQVQGTGEGPTPRDKSAVCVVGKCVVAAAPPSHQLPAGRPLSLTHLHRLAHHQEALFLWRIRTGRGRGGDARSR